MFHYSLFSFFRAHWKISMSSEALFERLLRNKNWPSPKCTVPSTRQNKNTLIFPHKVGCLNTGGHGCIQHVKVENSPKHHYCTWEADTEQSTCQQPQCSVPAPEPRWQVCTTLWHTLQGKLPQVLTLTACKQLPALCHTPCSSAVLCISQTCLKVFHKHLPLSWEDTGKVPVRKLKINKMLRAITTVSNPIRHLIFWNEKVFLLWLKHPQKRAAGWGG